MCLVAARTSAASTPTAPKSPHHSSPPSPSPFIMRLPLCKFITLRLLVVLYSQWSNTGTYLPVFCVGVCTNEMVIDFTTILIVQYHHFTVNTDAVVFTV